MEIQHARAEGLCAFVEAAPGHQEEVERYAEHMVFAGSMRPEWCFVAAWVIGGMPFLDPML